MSEERYSPDARFCKPPPRGYCEHHYCRCMRAAELAAQDLLPEAIDVHYQNVRCRLLNAD